MMARALVLFSGGLDSLLAARLLTDLCDGVTAICFTSPFFGSADARAAAGGLGLELVEQDMTGALTDILRAPRHGFGKNMNPCIDCHTAMISMACARLQELGADFLATGEVLGERPMSQNRGSLETVARESGAGELLLRPLSAGLLPSTLPEREGGGDRGSLLSIEGRSRKPQMELAAGWGIKGYKTPAGGCLLTDPGFSQRLRELMRVLPGFDRDDLELLKVGRHFWSCKNRLVLGRNDAENERLKSLALPTDHLLRERDRPGPTALVRTEPRQAFLEKGLLEEAAGLLGRYGKGKAGIGVDEVVYLEGGRD
jgi:tRNA-uridine 2-sulfurtransferase